jgi:pimeloyl-ACP methyl ester carboxylesterase
MAIAQIGDLAVSYSQAGSGPPLILLHGGMATAEMSWNKALPLLTPHFRVIMPDSRGHGETNNPADYLGYDQMADDMAALAGQLGIEKPLIFGFSDGGQIGIEMALRHPGFARAYVFGGTVSERTQDYVDSLKSWGFPAPGEVDLDGLREGWGPFFTTIQQAHKGNGEPEYWRKMLHQISRLWLELPSYSLDQLGGITEPSLVIMGDRDHLAGQHEPMRLYKALPNGELAVIPNADHGASETELFWVMVLDFLRRQSTT